MTFGSNKGTSSESQKNSYNGSQSQTETPNNLAALQQGWGAASDLLAGRNGTANSALDLLTKAATGATNAATGATSTAAGYAAPGATANGANGYLTPFANGSMTGNSNPYFQNLVDQISRQVQQSTDGNFAASGRYGSGANANAFNTAVTNAAGQLGYSNFNDSLNRQVGAADTLSTNNANSTNQALTALGLIPSLTGASTAAGQAGYGAATAPTTTYADILALLGGGGGTTTGTSSGNSTGTATGNTSSSGFGLNLGSLIKPFSLFG